MKKPARWLCCLLTAVFVLLAGGCADVAAHLKINADHSVDWSCEVLLNQTLASMGGNLALDWLKKQAATEEYKIADLNTALGSGVQASRHFASVASFYRAMQDNQSALPWPSGGNNRLTVEEKSGFLANTYSIDALIDLATASPADYGISGADYGGLSGVNLTFDVTLPGKATRSNASSVSLDGRTYTWELAAGKENQLSLTASVPNGRNIVVLLLCLTALAAVLLHATGRWPRRFRL